MNARGYSLAELMVVMVVIGILSLSAPSLISYWQASSLRAGARELASTINLGRQLAISRNATVCVQVTGTNIRFLTGGCAGTPLPGSWSDSSGLIRLSVPGGLQISTTANVVFTNLGAASTAGTYTVRNPVNNQTQTVVVAGSGRVTVP